MLQKEIPFARFIVRLLPPTVTRVLRTGFFSFFAFSPLLLSSRSWYDVSRQELRLLLRGQGLPPHYYPFFGKTAEGRML